MEYLGIDFGLKKIGLAVSEGKIAEPFTVIRYAALDEALTKIRKIIEERGVGKIIIGLSEGAIAIATRKFGKKLENSLGLTPEYWDETLSTLEAQANAIEANIGRKKRKTMEDAYAATLMLQGYLDSLR